VAAPYVAGVAALYLQTNPKAKPKQVRDALFNASTKGVVTSSSSANNNLLYSPPAGFGLP
jgi:subtilisin family serine protease